MKISPVLRNRCLLYARGFVNLDTGNMRYNAVKLANIKRESFSIVYDKSEADYIEYVNEGKGQPASRFVERAHAGLASQLSNYYNNASNHKKFRNFTRANIRETLENREDSAERQWRNLQSRLKAKGINYNWR